MDIDISEIRQLLTIIKDPKTGLNIVDAGLVKDLFLEGTDLTLMIYSNNLDTRSFLLGRYTSLNRVSTKNSR